MNAETDKVREALADQLSELDRSLGATVNDVGLLAGLQAEIGELLSVRGSAEEDIRGLLQERLARGDLRKETYRLVNSVLDRFATEDLETSPVDDAGTPDVDDDVDSEPSSDDPFASTTVMTQGLSAPASAEDRVQVGSVLRDRFLLQVRVAGGSMGVVYKALDRRMAEAGTDSPFAAIKVLSPQLSESKAGVRALQQEAAKGRCLLHPNIVRFIDLDRDDDLYFIVMEWMEGRTLADILDSPDTRTIDVDRTLSIVRQIGQALDYAHRCGITHADVKPGNIMILPDGTAKLFDFGVARVRQTQKGDEDFDPHAIGALTPAYSSMQVLNGEEPAPADDVFSLGCLMYRLVAGYRVFGPRNAAEAAEAGMSPQRLKSLDSPQWSALSKAISFSRESRFESMEAFLDALDAEAPLRATIKERLADHTEPRGRNGLVIGVVAALLVAAGVYQSGWLAQISKSADPPGARTGREPPATSPAESGPGPVPPRDGTGAMDQPPAKDLEPRPLPTMLPPARSAVDELSGRIDFDALRPADHALNLTNGNGSVESVAVTLRENSSAVTVDLLRPAPYTDAINLKVEEVGHSGNRSPWGARQFSVTDDGALKIPAGQDRARIELIMSADPLREADQKSTLRIRIAELPRSELGLLEVTLEDDDQRAFEAGLPSNTIAFAVSQVAVSERDPAVQVDILRFKPDDQAIKVEYTLQNITATEGDDYFSAGNNTVVFAPGQRTARVLVPLVQDSSIEGDEAFAVDLTSPTADATADVYRRLVVIVRDDEIARP